MRYSIQSAKTVEEATQKALDELRIDRKDATIEVIEEPSRGFLGLVGGKDAIVKVSKVVDNRDLLEEIFEEDLFTEPAPPVETAPKKTTRPEKREKKREQMPPREEKIVSKEAPRVEEHVEKAPVTEDTHERETPSPTAGKRASHKHAPLTDAEVEEKIRTYFAHLMESFGLEYSLTITMDAEEIRVNIDGDPEKMGIIIGKRGITLDSIQHILSLILNRSSDSFRRVIVDTSNYREKREETLIHLANKMADKALRSNRPIKLEPMDARERRIIHAALTDREGITTYSEGRDPYRKVVITKERKND